MKVSLRRRTPKEPKLRRDLTRAQRRERHQAVIEGAGAGVLAIGIGCIGFVLGGLVLGVGLGCVVAGVALVVAGNV